MGEQCEMSRSCNRGTVGGNCSWKRNDTARSSYTAAGTGIRAAERVPEVEHGSILIREASPEDAPRLLEIYGYYVEKTAITFEYDVPSVEEFRDRILHIKEKYPYLVIEEDGVIRGYAYAGVFKGRAAYDRSCEMTIYLDRAAAGRGPGTGRGLGRKLYEALEEELKARGILNLYACIGVPAKNAEDDEYLDHNSEQFHAHMGYTTVGRFHLCGYKFGRWYDMIWMEKMIGEHC